MASLEEPKNLTPNPTPQPERFYSTPPPVARALSLALALALSLCLSLLEVRRGGGITRGTKNSNPETLNPKGFAPPHLRARQSSHRLHPPRILSRKSQTLSPEP